jgi:hypothetical protein
MLGTFVEREITLPCVRLLGNLVCVFVCLVAVTMLLSLYEVGEIGPTYTKTLMYASVAHALDGEVTDILSASLSPAPPPSF